MPIYQNSTVTDSKLEVGNFAFYVGAENTTAGGTWVNLGAGQVNSMKYAPEMFTCQAGNAVDPLEGVSRETAIIEVDLIEYDGSAFSSLTSGMWNGTSGSITVGGVTAASALTKKGIKMVNTRRLKSGSTQTTTYVFQSCYVSEGVNVAYKSDNDADPIAVYSFTITAKQYATAGNIFTKTVA